MKLTGIMAMCIVACFLLSLSSPSVSAWGIQTNPQCDSPPAGRYDDFYVSAGYQGKTRGGYYAAMIRPLYGGIQYLETSWFEPGISNLSSNDGGPAMPGPLFSWPTQSFPALNDTINTVYIVGILNGCLGRNFQFGFSVDNRWSWTWQSNFIYIGANAWQGVSWNVTSMATWTPTLLMSPVMWAGIRSYDAAPWPLYIDYVGVAYNWTVGGPPTPPEEEEEEPTYLGGLDLTGLIGLIGLLGMVATPALAIWWARERDDKFMGLFVFLILGAVSFGFFLTGIN